MNNYDVLGFIEQVHTLIRNGQSLEKGVDDMMNDMVKNASGKMTLSDFNTIMDSIDQDYVLSKENKALCKQCIYRWRDKCCQEELITPKDIYNTLWKCRDFELSHLWQRSIFLTTFLFLCFTGYGCALMKICSNISDYNSQSLLILNIVSLMIALLGIVLSSLWIMMGKGSKAWYEKYELALYNIERNDRYCDMIVIKNMNEDAVMHGSLPDVNKDKNFLSTKAGPFSVSRINIAIGQISLIVWGIIYFLHLIFLLISGLVIIESNLVFVKFILIIICVILPIVPYILIKEANWCKSGGI